MPEQPNKILVIRRDNIGDLVCTTPLLTTLRQHYPRARIDVLVNSYNAPVLQGNPDINATLIYTKAKHRSSGEPLLTIHWRRLRLIWQLRCMRYDLVLLANEADTRRTLGLARWLKPGRIVRFALPGEAPVVTAKEIVVLRGQDLQHAVERTFALLAVLGVSESPPPVRVFSSAASISPSPTRPVAIHISARKPSQRWPMAHFAELMRCLHSQSQMQFMLFWSPGEQDNPLHPGDDEKAAELLRLTEKLPVTPCPTHQLRELIDGLSQCSAMICSDGGAMHIAAGLGLPIVCFFGQSDAQQWHPWGVPYQLLQPDSHDVRDISVPDALAAWSRLPGGSAQCAPSQSLPTPTSTTNGTASLAT